jgi:hypothetical protein
LNWLFQLVILSTFLAVGIGGAVFVFVQFGPVIGGLMAVAFLSGIVFVAYLASPQDRPGPQALDPETLSDERVSSAADRYIEEEVKRRKNLPKESGST